ncbi:YeiH family protein [Actinomycetaceae bacterium MB13-C1-2]|nr:YeiH family protein [Actinomycetaceae bacterium MB13-C1-2]
MKHVTPSDIRQAEQPAAPQTKQSWTSGFMVLLPGLALALGAATLSYGINFLQPLISPMIVSILLGVLLTNLVHLPDSLTPGINFASKKLLRAGIILLGLKLVLSDIVSLGAPMLLVVLAVVLGGILGTVLLGRLMRVPSRLTLLIATGFSICGAAAVAGAAGVLDPNDEHEEDTITAVALVVIFGTLMIPLLPALATLMHLNPETAGLWAGASVHEIAQVVAIGGILGGTALTVAVIVKLSRVLLMAPVVAVYSARQRALLKNAANEGSPAKLPPFVPPFIVGFLAMVALRSFVPLPDAVLSAGGVLQTALLAAAMFGLGCGVKIRDLRKVGLRPFLLAALSTVLVSVIAFAGIQWLA